VSNIPEFDPQRNVAVSGLPAPHRAAVPKINFARDAGARGLRVYPMAPNSDQPAFPEADCVATCDESQFVEWWHEDSDRNIGIATDNLLALRVKTAAGAAELGRLFDSHPGTPKTARIILDRAGREQENYPLFLVPKGVNVEARVSIAPGVDVLAFDDIIIGPGSELDGLQCVFANENSTAPAPLWLMKMCGVQLPEGKSMNNVIPMKKVAAAAPPAASNEAAAPTPVKTKLDWALEAAKYIPVHPIRWYVDPGPNASPDEREKAAKAAKAALLTDWPNRATQDPRQVRELWTQYPEANIGGATNNFIVVDIDNRNGGDETFAGLLAVEYDFPETATTRTQGGGRHLIYVAPDGPLKGGNHKLGNGIDVKAADQAPRKRRPKAKTATRARKQQAIPSKQ
jgi:hypothetical protein